MKKMLCSAAIVIVAILGVVSCENDLTPLGANFLGEDPANIIKEAEFDIKTYSVPVNPVQTSNFNSFPLGVYNDLIYGRSTYEIVTQVNLAFANPNVGNNTELLDVRIEIPYYSTSTGVGEDETLYRIDSLYGQSPISLEVYRSNYFLNSFDSESVSDRAVYYSNFKSVIESNRGELIYSNNAFFPVAVEEQIRDVDNEITERLSPRFRKSFNTAETQRWKEIMFQLDSAGEITDVQPQLANNNLFQDYFRGLYFKVTGAVDDGNLVHLNLNQARIVMTIQSDSDIVDDETGELIANPESEITINFNGNRVVLIENNLGASVAADIQTSNNPALGAENIYLKGGSGSLAIVELFGQATNPTDGESPLLSRIIANDWLINDAYIEFYVNRSLDDSDSNDAERILIYDYDTNRLLSDYVINAATGLQSNLTHLERLSRVDSEKTDQERVKYRLRLTQHLNNIIQGNLENTRLAVAVSQNVSVIGSSQVLNSVGPTNPDIESLPLSAAISHEGTVLYGNLATGNLTDASGNNLTDSNGNTVQKKPVLKVFYSETTN